MKALKCVHVKNVSIKSTAHVLSVVLGSNKWWPQRRQKGKLWSGCFVSFRKLLCLVGVLQRTCTQLILQYVFVGFPKNCPAARVGWESVCLVCLRKTCPEFSGSRRCAPHFQSPLSISLNPPSLLPNWAQRYQTVWADTLLESIVLHAMVRTDPRQAFSTSLQQWWLLT